MIDLGTDDGPAHALRSAIEVSAFGVEVFAVAVILVGTIHGTVRFLTRSGPKVTDPFRQYRGRVGKALLLGLEFLVAADIIRTVVLEPTLPNVLILGLLVVVRTFLSWSLVVEIEGRWPWQGEREGGPRDGKPTGRGARAEELRAGGS